MVHLPRLPLILLALVSASTASADNPARAACVHDREALLDLDFVAFDQTMGSGWRALSDAGCYEEAAALVRDWTARRSQNPSIMAFHEAQLWGYAGRADLAIPLFERIYRETADPASTSWKLYTEGNLAFLQRDRARMEAATAALAALPRPADWGSRRTVTADGRPAVLPAWPPNLAIMQAMLRCWNESYLVAAHCHLPDWRMPAVAD